MKPLLFLAFVSIVTSACGLETPSQSDTSSATAIIVAAERAWAKAAVERDVDTFAKYLSDDYVLIEVNTDSDKKSRFDTTTKSSWVETLRSGREKYDSVEVHNLKVVLNGDVATLTGEHSQKGTSDGKDISATGLYVNTWVKRKGQWKLVNSVFP
jgi:ketosteroid isomerase-like protein